MKHELFWFLEVRYFSSCDGFYECGFTLQAMEREREEQKERDALLEEERKKEEARQRKLEAKKVCASDAFMELMIYGNENSTMFFLYASHGKILF